jgi:hypothetical protein
MIACAWVPLAFLARTRQVRHDRDRTPIVTGKAMIISIHTLIYSDDAKTTRAFLPDVLDWKYVAEDWDNVA